MRSLRPLFPLAAALCAALTVAARQPAAAARKNPDKLPETRVQDLHYGDVLFYFYQDEDFEAITRLNAYEQWGRLLASRGRIAAAARRPVSLARPAQRGGQALRGTADARTRRRRAQPRVVLSREGLVRARLSRSRGACDPQVQGRLPTQLEAEKQHLFANILLRLGRFDEAVALLQELARARGLDGLRAVQPGRRARAREQARRGGSVPAAGGHASRPRARSCWR